jgi:hypothetical protein
MGYIDNPNGSDLSIVTVVLRYGVFATLIDGPIIKKVQDGLS